MLLVAALLSLNQFVRRGFTANREVDRVQVRAWLLQQFQ
jgi:hypothetical protein